MRVQWFLLAVVLVGMTVFFCGREYHVGNRTTFWLIWAVALVPMFAAFVMYFGQIGLPDGRTHHGELVKPGIQNVDIGLPNRDPPKWQVVLASTVACAPVFLKD